MNKRLSLCIVGCGKYAHVVMEYIADMTDEVDYSFASRDIEKAREYCEQYGGSAYYGSYEDAAADPRVDGLYFITPTISTLRIPGSPLDTASTFSWKSPSPGPFRRHATSSTPPSRPE